MAHLELRYASVRGCRGTTLAQMEVAAPARTDTETVFIRGFLQSVVAFRWLALGWAMIGALLSEQYLIHPIVAGLIMGLAFVFTAATTVLVRSAPQLLLTPWAILTEFAIGVLLLVGDGWVYVDARPQSLPWAWPAGALISGGIAFGVRAGVFLALALGIASFIGEGLNSARGGWGIAASSKTALYVLAAAVAGFVTNRLREAEEEVSAAKAREEVARTLHDGVLQTLAVVQRRSSDPELAQLAREQDRELRDFLFNRTIDQEDISVALRDAASKLEKRYGIHAQVVVADDLPTLAPECIRALFGAVSEALTNAAKHAEASTIVVYIEPAEDHGVFCSIKDNGKGFDPETAQLGEGLRRSIKERIEDADGRTELSSRIGSGTEVRVWVG